MACMISLSMFFLFSFLITVIHGRPLEQSQILLTSERVGTKFTHLHFYFHDILNDSEHPTSLKIINPPAGPFGSTYMVDIPLTEEPDLSSKLIGRAQGTYALASQQFNDLAFKMEINFVFTEGSFKGSTLSMVGRNAIQEQVREMPIVGGTGLFRLAHGYALAKTVSYNSTSGNAIEEFNVTVFHVSKKFFA